MRAASLRTESADGSHMFDPLMCRSQTHVSYYVCSISGLQWRRLNCKCATVSKAFRAMLGQLEEHDAHFDALRDGHIPLVQYVKVS